MIKAEFLEKKFGDFSALNKVSFEAAKGEIIGFLGPNGAGKTTLMRVLSTYLPLTSGKAEVGGYDVATQSSRVRSLIGYLPEHPPLYEYLTVKDYLLFAARIKGVSSRREKIQVDKVVEQCLLKDAVQRRIGTLSKGYRQRVGLAQAMIHDPAVIFLDEPTSGLDPVQNVAVRKLIQEMERDRTVILSTHILSEIAHLAKRVMIIHQGAIIVDESLDALSQGTRGFRRITMRLKGTRDHIYQLTAGASAPKLLKLQSEGEIHSLDVELPMSMDGYNQLVQDALSLRITILSMVEKKRDLEEVFFDAVGVVES
jgi:ABC-2 type transport system ATP-binding protein